MSQFRDYKVHIVLTGLIVLALLMVAWMNAPAATLAQTNSTEAASPVTLVLTVSNRSCSLAPGSAAEETPQATADVQTTPELQTTPAATAESTQAGVESYTLGPDCDSLRPLLLVPSNGTLWLSLTNADDPTTFLKISVVEGDEYPPKLDRRGRYFGCAIPEQGDHVCQVMAEVNSEMYWVQVPVQVGAAYIAPAPTVTATPEPVAQATQSRPQPPRPNQAPGT